MDKKTEKILSELARSLRGPDDDGCFEDISFLENTLKNVRIVALGEATHGTSEHFRYKHRFVRFLVEKMGFRTFIIEAAMDACDIVNDYVLYGRGNCPDALDAIHFWTWNTQEVAAMIEWMRRHNQNCQAGEEVSFLGFDLQSGDAAAKYLKKKLLPLAGEDAAELEDWINACDRIKENSGKPIFYKACQLLGWVEGYKPKLIQRSSAEEYAKLLRYSKHLFRHTALCALNWDSNNRDYWMAEYVRDHLSQQPDGGKAILWAHNAHVSKRGSWKTMGNCLKDLYGDKYFTIGFVLYTGSFRAKIYDGVMKKSGPLMEHILPTVPEDSWAYELHQIMPGNYYLDLHSTLTENPTVRAWAEQEKSCFEFGAVYDPINKSAVFEYDRGPLSEMFDAVLVTEKTTAAKGNKSD